MIKHSKEEQRGYCPHPCPQEKGVKPGSVRENPDKQEKGTPQITWAPGFADDV